ncbi:MULTISPECIES: flagellar protein FlgN [unclassified Paenibacillus]|uniref:flagellar protein FlgN n=1 Tax=unclassified Paenibacillus TaxID=185978 RepID=UPI00240715DE|nr:MULTISPECIES: flagellar protein FlgN [unclassified Paenibacillus]MDF9840134.1 flagellar biosynthesis/type III secretory pathway chaperone [Paenibacillus sp. PastF-2]MDF9846716.1 flagellar biosynthesis/type III secretory pathway chaperone [Paenibacillus sp. PastM-2]MDF9852935.1 flagellar biosynthesis/type III secretory pathway chaperone [Paenibacillus sp. PastF-1]MDH6478560.1 flagellar biosynthesis/type III secretory pathway chaperone [Paenibacillus sp. PastH-2]MDH6505942.1 flagellar biosynt
MALTKLLELLERLDDTHLQMLNLAAVKKQTIMDNRVDGLIDVMNRESKLMKLIGQLEEQRAEAAYIFLQGVGIRSNLNLNLTELSRLVFDPEDKSRLQQIQQKLSGTLQRLRAANELNQKLIEQSLTFIDYSLDLLVGRPNQEFTYHHPADKGYTSSRSGLFDARG